MNVHGDLVFLCGVASVFNMLTLVIYEPLQQILLTCTRLIALGMRECQNIGPKL